jgi:hypothetical protein
MIKSNILDLSMGWDDINSIIDDLKGIMDGMNADTPELNEFKVSIARAIASLRAQKIMGNDPVSRAQYVTTIANAKLREDLKAILD